jgi:hypothetical protein
MVKQSWPQLSKSAEFPGSAAVGELMRELALGYSYDLADR